MSEGHHDLITIPAPEGFVPHQVAHHFDSVEKEFQSCKLGFWLFLATEILLFGGLFAAYIYYHDLYPESFVEGGKLLNWQLGALNTVLLLASSWTMALGVRSAMLSEKSKMQGYLFVTFLCAGGFMVVKYIEYSGKIAHGLLPGYFFGLEPGSVYAEALGHLPYPNLFFSLYWTMTGIHGFHVLVGMILIAWLMVGGAKNRFHAGYYMPVEIVGLYWHLVDLIWIFLFPLLYLVP